MNKELIGANCFIEVDKIKKIPAKIDTGADKSSIWASNIQMNKDGVLSFTLFNQNSTYYTGKIFQSTNYSAHRVKSAMGEEQIRYRTHISVKINGKKIRVLFSLSDRSKNRFPVLIGKSSLIGKFIVDPSIKAIKDPKKTKNLTNELLKNPYEFNQKYNMGKETQKL